MARTRQPPTSLTVWASAIPASTERRLGSRLTKRKRHRIIPRRSRSEFPGTDTDVERDRDDWGIEDDLRSRSCFVSVDHCSVDKYRRVNARKMSDVQAGRQKKKK